MLKKRIKLTIVNNLERVESLKQGYTRSQLGKADNLEASSERLCQRAS